MNYIMIKDLKKEERPRERLIISGPKSLSNIELVSILLKTGTKDIPVNIVASKIINDLGIINELKDITINKLLTYKGIGKVKALELIAAIELGRRIYKNSNIASIKLNNANNIYNYFINIYNNEKQEKFFCIYLDQNKNLVGKELLFVGTLNKSLVHPREIFKHAYLYSAASIICVHNHPSGNAEPSKEDKLVTKSLVEIGKLQGIPILDHVIIGKNNYYSFFENNGI